MGAPYGNTNALRNSGGKKGRSGRKSYAQERIDYIKAEEMFFKKRSLKELNRKIKYNNFTFEDMIILYALKGKDRFLIDIFNKVYPDRK